MTKTVLSRANPNMAYTPRVGHVFYDHSALPPSKLYPAQYAVIRAKDGTTIRVDYSSRSEYVTHRDRVLAAISRLHSGAPRIQCQCTSCK